MFSLKVKIRQRLRSCGFEFWLPLPLLGVLFWLGSGWVTEQVMGRSYKSAAQLQADHQSPVQIAFSVKIVRIEANIQRQRGLTEVNVVTLDSPLKALKLELPMTELPQVEVAISKELQLPPEVIRPLVRYQVSDR